MQNIFAYLRSKPTTHPPQAVPLLSQEKANEPYYFGNRQNILFIILLAYKKTAKNFRTVDRKEKIRYNNYCRTFFIPKKQEERNLKSWQN